MDHRKIYTADLGSPCQESSNCGLRFVVVLLVCLGINDFCACTEGPIQLYGYSVKCVRLNFMPEGIPGT